MDARITDRTLDTFENEPGASRDERTRDAALLVRRLGPDGVDWLDQFLADYVFVGEPLDGVMVRARELSGLPPRTKEAGLDDD